LALCGGDAFVHATVILLGRTPFMANQQQTVTQRLNTGDEHT
jgi:hypothetical protein